jgi:hypothetical protein
MQKYPALGTRLARATAQWFSCTAPAPLRQTKTSMKEYLIVPVRIIEILNQAQQRWAIKTREFCFNVRPCGF